MIWTWNAGMRRVLLTFLMMTAVAAPAAAAEIVSAADISSVTRALVAAGYETAIKQDDDGETYILVDEGDDEFSVSFDDCEDDASTKGCNLLIFNATWEADEDFDNDVVNQFNQAATLAHAFIDDDGTLNLTLSVTTKGGLTAENFAEVIAIWQASDDDLSEQIDADGNKPPEAVIAELSAR